MRATVVDDETERNRLWQLADNVFPTFATLPNRRCRSASSHSDRPAHAGMNVVLRDRRDGAGIRPC